MKRTNYNRNFNSYRSYRNLDEITNFRFVILVFIIFIMLLVLFFSLFNVQVKDNLYYANRAMLSTRNYIYGETAPRGRIYDRNNNIIVDNKAVKKIVYKKNKESSVLNEIKIAYKLAELISVNYYTISEEDLKYFWIRKYPVAANNLINDLEWTLLSERKMTNEEIERLKINRITNADLSVFKSTDKKAAYIYKLMNQGYSFSDKIIKSENITEVENVLITENKKELPGVSVKIGWERVYPYGNLFRSIIGKVSDSDKGVPYELKDYYLNKGYSLDDRVGVSYLEFQYEDYLRGKKNKYITDDLGNLILIEPGQRGNDLVLTIDIELQKEVERILEEELINAKNSPNTEYFNRSFVVIQEPKTGEILAMSGKKIVKDPVDETKYIIEDFTPGVVTSTVTPGSAIKGASHIVGYNTGALKIGEKRYDACVKIAETPLKCSWRYLGLVNDITALKYSSNTYQFYTAIKVGDGDYNYDQPLVINSEAFKTYRTTFAEFGLGVKTGIDLPVESTGYDGTSKLPGHLLDFSIGQYDNYTPIQLSQYITTIANKGVRVKPHLLKAVYNPVKDGLTSPVKSINTVTLNNVNTEDKYFDRIFEGFKEVLKPGGTSYGTFDLVHKPAGKTGTSQSFVDTNNDGVIDTETYSNLFVGFAPYDNPKVTFTFISPDVSHPNPKFEYTSPINRTLTYKITEKFFEIYK